MKSPTRKQTGLNLTTASSKRPQTEPFCLDTDRSHTEFSFNVEKSPIEALHMEAERSQTKDSFDKDRAQTEAPKMQTEKPVEVCKSELTLLHDLAILHNLHVQFKEGKHLGPPAHRIFLMELCVGDFVGFGCGSTKKKGQVTSR